MSSDNQNPRSSPVNISKSLAAVNASSAVVARVINVGLILWVQQYLIQRIAPEEYSLYPVLVSLTMLLTLAKAVFTAGIARYLAAARATDDNERIEKITSTTFAINGVAAAILLVAGLVFAVHVDQVITVDPAFVWDARVMMAILVSSLALKLAFASFEMGLIVEQRFLLINGVELLSVLLRLAIMLVLIFGISTRVLWVAVATEIASTFGLGVKVALSRRYLPALRFRASQVDLAIARELLQFGSWSLVGMIAYRIRHAADPIILNQLAGPVDVNAYYVGSIIPKQIVLTTHQAGQVFLPSLTAMHATGQSERLSRTYIRYGRIMSFVFLFVATPVIALRSELVELYAGTQYAAAAAVLLLILVATALEQPYEMLWQIASAQGKIKRLAVLSVASQIFNLGLTIVLVGVYGLGAIGAALSTLVTKVVLEFWIGCLYGSRLAGVKTRNWLVNAFWRGLSPAILTLAIVYVVRLVLVPSLSWFNVFAHAAGYAVIYSAIALGFATKQDRHDLRRMFAAIFDRLRGRKARITEKESQPGTG